MKRLLHRVGFFGAGNGKGVHEDVTSILRFHASFVFYSQKFLSNLLSSFLGLFHLVLRRWRHSIKTIRLCLVTVFGIFFLDLLLIAQKTCLFNGFKI